MMMRRRRTAMREGRCEVMAALQREKGDARMATGRAAVLGMAAKSWLHCNARRAMRECALLFSGSPSASRMASQVVCA